jgi:hypothetical protein
MKFKEMTNKDKDYFINVYKNKDLSWDERMSLLMEFTGKSERTVRKWASEKLKINERKDVIPEEYKEAKQKVFNSKKKRFIITWAQNNTPIHKRFFENLKKYAKHIDADIHVIAGRYKNPTSIWTNNQNNEEAWHPHLKPYLDANRHDIHRYLSIMSDIKIQPTAVNPMTGLQAVSGENSCIFGSPKLQMEMIPVLEGQRPKMMLTTGACTVKNYTDSKAGKKGEFHHVIGFCVVEIKDDETFYVRQVSADDNGDFTDLFNRVEFVGKEVEGKFSDLHQKLVVIEKEFTKKPTVLDGLSKVTKIKSIEGCVLGDLHVGQHEEEVIDLTHNLLGKLKPKNVVLHDVFDGYSISHHDSKDPIAQYSKEFHGNNDLSKELNEMYEVLDGFEKYDNVVVARANHDDFADRWIKNQDWKKQSTPKNFRLYSKFMDMMLEEVENNPSDPRGVIPILLNERYPSFKTLGRRDSFKIKGYETGLHGDVGSNGSRGSLQQYRKLNTKIIVGHYHTPGRKDGALAVGTSTKLRIGYNIGPSSWLQSLVIIHEDSKAQHINFIRDKKGKMGFTTLK